MLDSYRQVKGENSAYRKGLVLGLTMAEIMLLLLFALMLIIGATWTIAKREMAARDEKLKTFELALDGLGPNFSASDILVRIEALRLERETQNQELARLRPLEQNARIVDDILQNLRRSREPMTAQQLAERLRAAAAIEAALGGTPARDAAERIKEAAAVMAALGTNSAREAAERIRLAKAISEAIPGVTEKQVTDLAAALPDILRNIDSRPGDAPGDAVQRYVRELTTARGQLAQLTERLARLSRGNEFPSCWVTPTGGTESIFDVFFNSGGIELRERPLPHRAAERAELPLSSIQYGRDLSTADFLQQIRGLYEWSVANKCRFYVVRFTRSAQATVEHVNAVGRVFYPDSSIRRVP